MRLKDKTILITAAGQGMGRAAAIACAAEGARVIATDRDPALLAGLTVETHALDVTDPAALIEMAAARQAFVDQSQSLNLFIESPNIGKLSSMYLYAWKAGLKGITTYRPNSVLGSVLSVEPAAAAPQDLDQSEPDRRIRITGAPQVALAALR